MTLAERLDRLRRYLWSRQHNYRLTFNSPPGKEVLADLARFCRATRSTFHENDRAHVLAEGRREVWLRISNHLHLTQDELFRLVNEGE